MCINRMYDRYFCVFMWCLILFVTSVALVVICMMVHFKNKCRSLDYKVSILEGICNNLKETNISIASEYSNMKCLMLKGKYDLVKRSYDDHIDVVGTDPTNIDLFFVIKRIEYVPNNDEEYDFAERRADELIEDIERI